MPKGEIITARNHGIAGTAIRRPSQVRLRGLSRQLTPYAGWDVCDYLRQENRIAPLVEDQAGLVLFAAHYYAHIGLARSDGTTFMTTRKRRLGLYTVGEFEDLCSLVSRVPGHRLDRKALLIDLRTLFAATGVLPERTGPASLWKEMKTEPRRPRDMAALFRRAAVAPNPLAADACTPAMAAYVSHALRRRWQSRWRREGRPVVPSWRTVEWDALTDVERDEVREAMTDLAVFFQGQVRRGPPHRTVVDTLMEGLAEIWIDQTNWEQARTALPASRSSRFIRFCERALDPVAAIPEPSAGSLSERWRRLQRHEAGGAPP